MNFSNNPDKQRSRSLFVSALSNWLTLFITVAVGFYLTPFIIKHIGKTGYGIWTLIGSVIGYYGILDLGVTSAITRYVARHLGQNDYKSLNNSVNTSLVLFCLIGLCTAILSFVIAGPLAGFFRISSDQVGEFVWVVRLIGISAGLSFPGNLLGAVIRAHERFIEANIINIIITLIRTGLTVVVDLPPSIVPLLKGISAAC